MALRCSFVSPLLLLATTGERPPEFVYADPHLLVLLFLLGFCLLYVLILIADNFVRSDPGPREDPDWIREK